MLGWGRALAPRMHPAKCQLGTLSTASFSPSDLHSLSGSSGSGSLLKAVPSGGPGVIYLQEPWPGSPRTRLGGWPGCLAPVSHCPHSEGLSPTAAGPGYGGSLEGGVLPGDGGAEAELGAGKHPLFIESGEEGRTRPEALVSLVSAAGLSQGLGPSSAILIWDPTQPHARASNVFPAE